MLTDNSYTNSIILILILILILSLQRTVWQESNS